MQVYIKTIRFGRQSYFFLSDNNTIVYISDLPPHTNDYIVYDVDTSDVKGFSDEKFQHESSGWWGDIFMKASDVMHLIGDNT